ncbi:acyltransferase family protein [Sphingomonas sp. 35-24ZXX]|uniref:acyltransferase family protein n=1 Tax=Sphingomonas sp. 35-24ZXX TaxID=1545915 RepID=UPI0018CE337C|nr:acyltransferase [Sphingomonas sp. 35-24ZXX]
MRYKQLDSLRGLAALVVIVYHCLITLPQYGLATSGGVEATGALIWILARTPLHIFVAGTAAVMLFFVLSGFVLTLALERASYGYFIFLSQRFIRLFPPFAASILLSAFFYTIVEPKPLDFVSEWFNFESWTAAPTFAVIAGHLGMVLFGELYTLNNVMWSLVIEMRVSILFPFIFWLTRKHPCLSLMASFGLMLASLALGRLHLLPEWVDSWLLTARVLWLFVAGGVLAHKRTQVSTFISGLNKFSVRMIFIISLLALGFPAGINVTIVSSGIGSVLLIGLIIASPKDFLILEWRPLLYLGKISYSLYLVHLPILLIMVHAVAAPDRLTPVLAAGAGCALLAAHILHFAVERPCHRLARKLSESNTNSHQGVRSV